MGSKLVLSEKLGEKLNQVNYTLSPSWSNIGVSALNDLESKILEKLNALNTKFKIKSLEYKKTGQSNQSYGFISDENDRTIAYVFVISPGSAGRNVVAQSTMTALYPITSKLIKSDTYELTNLPVFIIYLNEDKIQQSKSQEIMSTKILGFNFIDIFERDPFEEIRDLNLYFEIYDLQKYDSLLKGIRADNLNKYFDIDMERNIVTIKTDTLGNADTNERYFYTLKNYPALCLASKDCYEINIDTLTRGNYNNETIKTFIAYANKLKSI